MVLSKHKKTKIRGVAAVEFALVFPVLFLMLYGLLTYSLIFAMQHSLSLAAAEGGRAAVRFIMEKDDIEARRGAACEQIQESLSWLRQIVGGFSCPGNGGGGNGLTVKVDPTTCPGSNSPQSSNLKCLDIRLIYAYGAHPLIPKLLPVPENLTASSFTQIALSY